MTDLAAGQAGLTPVAAETVVAAILVALVVGLAVVVGYAVVVSSLAWVLVVLVGLVRLGWASLYVAALRVRRRLHRRPRVPAVGLPPGPPGTALRS
jgi:hypothetical protein